MNILIVDDEIQIVEILTEFLEEMYTVRSANSPHDALNISKEFIPDILITDYNMPNMDGAVLSEIITSTHKCSVIMITGDVDAEIFTPNARILRKPIKFSELLKLIKELG